MDLSFAGSGGGGEDPPRAEHGSPRRLDVYASFYAAPAATATTNTTTKGRLHPQESASFSANNNNQQELLFLRDHSPPNFIISAPCNTISSSSPNHATTAVKAAAGHNDCLTATSLMPRLKQEKLELELEEDISELPAIRARVRQHVESVVRSSCLPQQDTAAYQQAVAKDWSLVLEESDPIMFIRACQYNLLDGVKQLCRYWKERLALFGPERAFLPLTLTGTGALTHQDLLTLRAGYPALLPNATTGHKCILFDRRSKVPDVTTEGVLRCLFYLFKVLAESDFSQQVDGVIALVVAATPRCKDSDMDWDYAHRATALVASVFPVQSQVHLLSVPQQKLPSLATKLVTGIVQLIREYAARQTRSRSLVHTKIQVHVQTPGGQNTILDELLALGLSKKSVPHFYGGQWKQEAFFEWCQTRMEWESNAYQGRLLDHGGGGDTMAATWHRITQRAAKDAFPLSSPVVSGTAVAAASTPAARLAPESVASNSNNLFSNSLTGASRVGPQQQRDSHDQEHRGSKKSNGDIHSDKARSLILVAQQQQQQQHQQQQQRRVTDLIRSRQKRERARIVFQELQEELFELKVQNKRLQSEHVRLSLLVVQAEQCVTEQLPL
ncbi:hypothetical protein ACA910_002226 [Epithemia clementina (nom. ined.)]